MQQSKTALEKYSEENGMEHQHYREPILAPLPRPASKVLSNLAFLLLSFPLALLYFILTVCGLLLGLGTLVIWAGLPILFTTILTVRALAEVERHVVSSLLFIPMARQRKVQPQQRQGFLKHLGRLLNDPYTWTSIIYMLLKLPLGIINLVLALVLPILCGAFTFLPLIYLINLFINTILLSKGIPSGGILIPGFIVIHGGFESATFIKTFIGIPIGIVGWFISRIIISYAALISGELARALLGPGLDSPPAQPHTPGYARPMTLRPTEPMISREQQG